MSHLRPFLVILALSLVARPGTASAATSAESVSPARVDGYDVAPEGVGMSGPLSHAQLSEMGFGEASSLAPSTFARTFVAGSTRLVVLTFRFPSVDAAKAFVVGALEADSSPERVDLEESDSAWQTECPAKGQGCGSVVMRRANFTAVAVSPDPRAAEAGARAQDAAWRGVAAPKEDSADDSAAEAAGRLIGGLAPVAAVVAGIVWFMKRRRRTDSNAPIS